MAAGTIVTQDGSYQTGWYGETTADTRKAGYDGMYYYAYLLTFKTPSWTSASHISNQITFELGAAKVYGDSVTLNYAICTSSANKQNYVNTHSAVSDSAQIATGTVALSGLTATMTYPTISVSTSKLAPNTTYYLYLWATSDSSQCVAFQGCSYHSVDVTTAARTFALSISAGTGSTITVKRSGTALSDGATITYGDVLTISFTAKTGYNLGTHTVNGSAFDSGGTHTVTDAVAVVSTATLKTFKLSISAGTGSTIAVKRNGTAISNGDTITYGDVLTISFGASTGYNLSTHTVNGTTFDSGGTHTVTGDVSVVAYTLAKEYTVTYNGNGGTYNGSPTWSETVSYSEAYTTHDNFFVREGYQFAGWVDQNGVVWTKSIGVPWAWSYDYNVTLYAQWTPKTYTVTYDGNGGIYSGNPTWSETVSYSEAYTTHDNFFVREGYEFRGWVDQNGVDWTNSIGTPWVWSYDYDVTLYAQWVATGFVYLTVGGVVNKFRIIVHHNGSWRKYRPVILHSDTDISAFGVGGTIVIATSLPVSTEGDTIIIGGD